MVARTDDAVLSQFLDILGVAPAHVAIAALVTFIAALVQGTIGLGFAIFSVPVLSLLDPRLAPVPQLLVTLPMSGYMAYRELHAVEVKSVVWVLLGRLPGALTGLWLLKVASSRTLDVIIGSLVLFAAVVFTTPVRITRNRATEFIAGIASGIGGLVSAISGPPVALLYRDAHGPEIRANLALIFSVGVMLTIATRLVAGEVTQGDALVAACIFPGVLLGMFMSRFTMRFAKGAALKGAVLGVSALAALGLLARAL